MNCSSTPARIATCCFAIWRVGMFPVLAAIIICVIWWEIDVRSAAINWSFA